MSSILVSGASIAGPALGWWLARFGFSVTLVERSAGPRPGGHAIDVRGAAIGVLRAMSLETSAREQRTRIKRLSVLNADGAEVWHSEEMSLSGGSFTGQSIEILRDDMSDILMSALPASAEFIYGDSVVSLDDHLDGVTVGFENAPSREFDLVIGADGIGSNIRCLAFGPDEGCIHSFGFALALFSTPNLLGLADAQISYEMGSERCLVYTARENTELRVCFAFATEQDEVPPDRSAQIFQVKSRCGDWGWEVPRLLDTIEDAPDFYAGPMAQVRAQRWNTGRIALVGDAAYCPSPLTGQGTSLALVGAYLLGSELATEPADHCAAFDRYEARMRPFVAQNQALADLALNLRFEDPEYYSGVFEPALLEAQDAIDLGELS